MSAYLSCDVYDCLAKKHHFIVAGSDKTPMKRSLICETCSGNGKTAYAAYGVDTLSKGPWRRRKIEKEKEV